MGRRAANCILMISPDTFGYNDETAATNSFQRRYNYDIDTLRKMAMEEFNNMVNVLKSNGVDVFVFGNDSESNLPDAVFPNNWFATYEDGTAVLFPMLSETRRKERDKGLLEEILDKAGFKLKQMVDFAKYENQNLILEGTGSLVLDRKNNAVFAIESERTTKEMFDIYCETMNISPVNRIFFHAYDEKANPIYHTNVIMTIGEGFAVICDEYITDTGERNQVMNKLRSLGLEIITINYNQLKSFCGNILNVKSRNGESLIMMSATARKGFDNSQIKQIEKYGRIIDADISTIENAGGGSARCMMAEIFLPGNQK